MLQVIIERLIVRFLMALICRLASWFWGKFTTKHAEGGEESRTTSKRGT